MTYCIFLRFDHLEWIPQKFHSLDLLYYYYLKLLEQLPILYFAKKRYAGLEKEASLFSPQYLRNASYSLAQQFGKQAFRCCFCPCFSPCGSIVDSQE
jgi:hypothetical protein